MNAQKGIFPDGRMTPESAGAFLGFTPKTLAQWRSKGIGPAFRKIGGRIFYHLSDLQAYIEDREKVTSTGQARCFAQRQQIKPVA